MRDYVFVFIFFSSLPLIFVSPFYGVLIWYAFSLGNLHTLMWGIFGNLYLAYFIAILTAVSWLFSRTEKKRLPLTPLVVLTLLFSLWMTITSCFALGPANVVWERWLFTEKILLMCLVGYALTTTRERVDQMIWVIVLAVGLWGVKGALSIILHGGRMYGGIHGPDLGVESDNNSFGIALIMILPLLFYQWHIAVNRHIRHALMIMGFLISIAIIYTYSRGALVGVCAMGAVLWLRSRAKLATSLLIVVVALSVYLIVPQAWFDRMATIDDPNNPRLMLWQICLRIAQLHPILGGGFWVTYFTDITNAMLVGTDLQRLTIPRATHSIWFDALSEHGWVGLGFFVSIAGYSLYNCSWLIRRTRGRADLAWANLLGRMSQSTLVGFWVSASFGSLAYFDAYWGIIFVLDAARRVVAKQIASPARTFQATTPLLHAAAGSTGPDARVAYARGRDFRIPTGAGEQNV